MYLDKLDGQITQEFFDKQSAVAAAKPSVVWPSMSFNSSAFPADSRICTERLAARHGTNRRQTASTARKRLFIQNVICLGVDFLVVRCAQFALMLHLGGPSLGISGVICIRHWIFAFRREPEFLSWLCVLLGGCKFCHNPLLAQSASK
jgi:hypothetical protein